MPAVLCDEMWVGAYRLLSGSKHTAIVGFCACGLFHGLVSWQDSERRYMAAVLREVGRVADAEVVDV